MLTLSSCVLHGCSPHIRNYAHDAARPCLECEELLWLCDHGPKTWQTHYEVKRIMAALSRESFWKRSRQKRKSHKEGENDTEAFIRPLDDHPQPRR